jgi:hypothetical protein
VSDTAERMHSRGHLRKQSRKKKVQGRTRPRKSVTSRKLNITQMELIRGFIGIRSLAVAMEDTSLKIMVCGFLRASDDHTSKSLLTCPVYPILNQQSTVTHVPLPPNPLQFHSPHLTLRRRRLSPRTLLSTMTHILRLIHTITVRALIMTHFLALLFRVDSFSAGAVVGFGTAAALGVVGVTGIAGGHIVISCT